MLVRAHSRDVLLPVLLYPMTIPVIIAGVRGTAALMQPLPDEPMATVLADAADVVRYRLPDARALDVRPADDGLRDLSAPPRVSAPRHRARSPSFAAAPFLIDSAPYESTMGLVQKIFYFHAPAGIMMFLAAFVCGVRERRVPVHRQGAADRIAAAAAELTVLFGAIVLMTGPLWGAQGMGRLVAMGRAPHLVAAALDDVRGMSAGAAIRRARLGEARGGRCAMFGMCNVPFVYVSVNVWRTVHPKTTVVPSLGPGMRGPVLVLRRRVPVAVPGAAGASRAAGRAAGGAGTAVSRARRSPVRL